MDNLPSQTTTKRRYRAVFISPHLDDAVFSCGGTIAKLVEEGPVLVINLFTRYLSEVRIRGVVLGDERYQEEAEAAHFLGFESRNLGELDVSFRREAYRKLGNIFRPPVAEDLAWLPTLRAKVFAVLAELNYQQLYVPLGIGWHVDHVLTYLMFEPWAKRDNLLYYEDAPYCCIPNSTRYRINELGQYKPAADDLSLAPINELQAWWQTSMAYAQTALMKNLKPWIVRVLAIPVTSFYFYRLMSMHRKGSNVSAFNGLTSLVLPIVGKFDTKVEAMSLYRSQFKEFFKGRMDCISMLLGYANRICNGTGPMERYWTFRK